jgi:chitodextrinase
LDVPGEAPEPPSSPPDIIDPPAVTSCDPNFGGVGTVVTLTGTNFFDPVTVQWTDGTNTYASTSVTIINTTEVTADANVGSKKNSRWTVIVTTLVGQASLDNAFQCDGTLLTGYIPIEPFPDPSDALQAQEAPNPAPEALGGSGGTTDPSPATTEGPTEINIQADQVTVQADEVTVQGPEVSSEGTTEPSEEAEQVEMTEYEMDQMWGITEPGAEPEP